ncbi:hypothetical protein [Pyrobaculum neutrophilum]|uniref:Uncharacterized protein n=1 Tax=Pyrobaculum neutrophilum (strain DSM 2338 / JCM 9278 / NBRC 100436 / V24Sta) TaxID=444157 RepID=B1Y8Q0_PYRNV|nr:hypothetical protein [Pyrobaculum neutrophilum]ACB40129.1 conserved hypothetical protein [Pyrobaculum neutrophilum V24Sta]
MDISTSSIDELVLEYFRRLEERGLGRWVDEVFPTSSRLDRVRELAGRSAEDAVEALAGEIAGKIVAEVAAEVVGAPAETAVWLLARRIALWYLQLAVELGVVRARR